MKNIYKKKRELLSITCLIGIILAVFISDDYPLEDPFTANNPGTSEAERSDTNTDAALIPITEQINVILSHKDVWLKEEVRMEINAIDDQPYADGPYYSLMDLDQDGYLELIAYSETGNPALPSMK